MGTEVRRFLAGAVVGALLMYYWVYHGDETLEALDAWMNGSSSEARGDPSRRSREEAASDAVE